MRLLKARRFPAWRAAREGDRSTWWRERQLHEGLALPPFKMMQRRKRERERERRQERKRSISLSVTELNFLFWTRPFFKRMYTRVVKGRISALPVYESPWQTRRYHSSGYLYREVSDGSLTTEIRTMWEGACKLLRRTYDYTSEQRLSLSHLDVCSPDCVPYWRGILCGRSPLGDHWDSLKSSLCICADCCLFREDWGIATPSLSSL